MQYLRNVIANNAINDSLENPLCKTAAAAAPSFFSGFR